MSYDSQRLGLPDREETIKAPILADGSLNKIIYAITSITNSLLSVRFAPSCILSDR